MDRPPVGRRRFFSIRAVAPNVVTLAAFCAGLTAVRLALLGKWELACAAIVLAGVFDGLDGTVARLLKASSRFGAELDSLSDISVFGICPVIILYVWSLNGLPKLGWIACLIYGIAMILRLARFNARLEDEDEPQKALGYNTGIPAPMGAGLAIGPMVIDLVSGTNTLQSNPLWVAVYLIGLSALVISAIPTLSLKSVRIGRDWFVPSMVGLGALIAALYVYTWETLLVIAYGFMATMPVTWIRYRRKRAEMLASGAIREE